MLRIASMSVISLLLVLNSYGAIGTVISKFLNFQKCIGNEIKKLEKQQNIENLQRERPQALNKESQTNFEVGDFWSSIKHYLSNLFAQRRSEGPRRWVEVGPGAYKSEIIEYPPDKLKNDLKKLIALKEAKEKRTMNSNA